MFTTIGRSGTFFQPRLRPQDLRDYYHTLVTSSTRTIPISKPPLFFLNIASMAPTRDKRTGIALANKSAAQPRSLRSNALPALPPTKKTGAGVKKIKKEPTRVSLRRKTALNMAVGNVLTTPARVKAEKPVSFGMTDKKTAAQIGDVEKPVVLEKILDKSSIEKPVTPEKVLDKPKSLLCVCIFFPNQENESWAFALASEEELHTQIEKSTQMYFLSRVGILGKITCFLFLIPAHSLLLLIEYHNRYGCLN